MQRAPLACLRACKRVFTILTATCAGGEEALGAIHRAVHASCQSPAEIACVNKRQPPVYISHGSFTDASLRVRLRPCKVAELMSLTSLCQCHQSFFCVIVKCQLCVIQQCQLSHCQRSCMKVVVSHARQPRCCHMPQPGCGRVRASKNFTPNVERGMQHKCTATITRLT